MSTLDDPTSALVGLAAAIATPVGNAVVTRQPCIHLADAAPAHLNNVAVTFAAPELVPVAPGGARQASGATPDLAQGALLHLTQSEATTLAGITNAPEGQPFTIIFGDANTTVPHGTVFRLKTGGDLVAAADRTLSLVRYGSSFYEV